MKRILIALTLIFQLSISATSQVPKAPGTQPGGSKAREASPQDPVKPGDEDVVRITTNLVQVDPVVTDSKGKPVTDLRPEEVQILEDGKPQQITNFSYIALDAPVVTKSTPPPPKNGAPAPPVRVRPDQVRRTIALVVDDLGLSFESAYYVRQALKKFLDQQMQPNDLVAIIRTGGGIGALQQFTTDKRQLYAAVEKVKWNPMGRGGISAFAPLGGERISVARSSSGEEEDRSVGNQDLDQFRSDVFAVGTLGAVNYIVGGLRNLPGRKSVILMSDGFRMFSKSEPTGSARIMAALSDLTDMANRASVVIYTLDPRGLQTLGLTAADNTADMSPSQVQDRLNERRDELFASQDSLNYLAKQTGGLGIRNTNDLSGAIRRAIEDEGGYYLIGYRPQESTFESSSGRRKFHKLSLKINRPGKFNVRMRNGFYGITDEEAKPALAPGTNRIIAALTSPFGSADIHVRLTSLFANDAKVGSIMRSMLHVKASDLTFKEESDGWHTSTFDILAYTFGDNGVVVDQMGRQYTIRIKGKTYERILKDGFTYYLTVPVKKPGAYQLRTALRDVASERVGSASQFIEVPDIKKNRLTLSGVVLNGVSPQTYKTEEPTTPSGADGSDDARDGSDPKASPSVRQFKSGLVMTYAYHIYNARTDKAAPKPQLVTQVKLFRSGQEIFTGKEIPFDASNHVDLKRLVGSGAIQLGSEMVPGEYVFQVIVTDLKVTGKNRVTSQWIDFEIVK
ncbi:MAG TPA: VWA domain-containing protein [Pyrinomonadaceae bacterium]|nr:VWA domain-containing protein [Pyrinomonadaceae bacterium]